MKMAKYAILVAVSFLLGFSACKQEEGCTDEAATNFDMDAEKDDGSCVYDSTPDSVDFVLEFNAKVGSEPLDYSSTYTDTSGATYTFSIAQFYVSKIQLLGYDNEMLEAFDEVYVLVKPDQTSYPIGKVAPGHKHMVMFNVGMDSLTNNQSESMFVAHSADDARSIQNPSMHWSWNTGYIFLKVEGEIDENGDGIHDSNFLVHVGLDEMRQRAMVMAHADAVLGETLTVSLDVDFSSIFQQVGVLGKPNTITLGSPEDKALALQIIQDFTASIQ